MASMVNNPAGEGDASDVIAPRITAGGHFTVAFTFTSKRWRYDISEQEYSDLLASAVTAAVHGRYPDMMIQRLEQDENKDGFKVWG